MMLFEGEQKGTGESHFRITPDSCFKNVLGRKCLNVKSISKKNAPKYITEECSKRMYLLNKERHQHNILHKLSGGILKENQVGLSRHDKELNATL